MQTIWIRLICSFFLALLMSPTAFARKVDQRSERLGSKELSQALLKHDQWLSFIFINSPEQASMPGIPKRWKVNRLAGSRVALEETLPTHLVVVKDRELSRLIAKPGYVRIDDRIVLSSFAWDTPVWPQGSDGKAFRLKKLRGERLLLTFPGEDYAVILTPTTEQAAPVHDNPLRDRFGVSIAPYSMWRARAIDKFRQEALNLDTTQVPATSYVHLSFDKRKTIYVDDSFPTEYVPLIEEALSVWNAAFPAPAFDLRIIKQKISFADCLSSDALCFKWSGSRRISWFSIHGQTNNSFDPLSGILRGGIIDINSFVDESKLRPSSAEDVALLKEHRMSNEIIARIMTEMDKYDEIEHPLPQLLVRAALIHEIGHFVGFEHDFHSYMDGTPQKPISTVMGYAPRPALDASQELGPLDYDKIDFVYRGHTRYPDHVTCDELDVFPRKNKAGFITVNDPTCNVWTIGDPIEWIGLLAQARGGDLTAPYYRQFGSGNEGANTLANRLGYFLQVFPAGSREHARASQLICNDPKRETTTAGLRKWLGVELNCDQH